MSAADPPEVDVKDFKFQQIVKARIQDATDTVGKLRENCLAVANNYGLVFIATSSGFKVLSTGEVLTASSQIEKKVTIVQNVPIQFEVNIGLHVCHISVSSDNLTLAVCCKKNDTPFAILYDIRSFARKDVIPNPFLEVRLSTAAVDVQDLVWNPNPELGSLFASCLSDGSVNLWSIKDGLNITATLPPTTKATCLCWSPKGKQIVVGKQDGSMAQYDQNLTKKKDIPAPALFVGIVHTVLDVLWESTHVFLAAYIPQGAAPDIQPTIVLTHFPKDGVPTFTSYEDVCFGGGEDRLHKYYFNMLPEWDMIVAASANALEAGVLGKKANDKNSWERWNLEDAGRAEIPLTDNYEETYPVGMAVDLTSQTPVIVGENQTHPASPVLYLLSSDGILVVYHMLSYRPGAALLTRAPKQLTAEGARVGQAVKQPPAPAPAPALASTGVARSLFSSTQPPSATSTPAPKTAFGGITTSAAFHATPKPAFGGGSMFGAAVQETPAGSSTFGFSGAASLNITKPLAQSTPAPAALQKPGKVSSQGLFTFGNEASKPVLPTQPPNPASTGFSFAANPDLPKPQPIAAPVSAAPTSPPSAVFSFAAKSPSSPAFTDGQKMSAFGAAPTVMIPGSSIPASSLAATSPQPQRSPKSPQVASAMRRSQKSAVSPTKPMLPAGQLGTMDANKMTRMAQVPQSYPAPVHQRGPPSAMSAAPPPYRATPAHLHGTAHHGHDNPFNKSIMEEVRHFEQELAALVSSTAQINVGQIGSREEMQRLILDTRDMNQFMMEMKETTQSLNNDVHALKMHCLEGFSLHQECEKQSRRHADPAYQSLLHQRPLDPASQRRLQELRSDTQAIQGKVRDVNEMLETEWETHQNSKNKAKQMRIPASDAVYKTLMANRQTISDQQQQVDRLRHLQGAHLHNTSSAWTPSPSSLKDSTLWDGTTQPGSGSPYLTPQSRENNGRNGSNLPSTPEYSSPAFLNASLSPRKSVSSPISPEKESKLRQILGNRKITPVKATAPANLSMSKIASAETLRRALTDPYSPRSSPGYTGSDSVKTSLGSRMDNIPMATHSRASPQLSSHDPGSPRVSPPKHTIQGHTLVRQEVHSPHGGGNVLGSPQVSAGMMHLSSPSSSGHQKPSLTGPSLRAAPLPSPQNFSSRVPPVVAAAAISPHSQSPAPPARKTVSHLISLGVQEAVSAPSNIMTTRTQQMGMSVAMGTRMAAPAVTMAFTSAPNSSGDTQVYLAARLGSATSNKASAPISATVPTVEDITPPSTPITMVTPVAMVTPKGVLGGATPTVVENKAASSGVLHSTTEKTKAVSFAFNSAEAAKAPMAASTVGATTTPSFSFKMPATDGQPGAISSTTGTTSTGSTFSFKMGSENAAKEATSARFTFGASSTPGMFGGQSAAASGGSAFAEGTAFGGLSTSGGPTFAGLPKPTTSEETGEGSVFGGTSSTATDLSAKGLFSSKSVFGGLQNLETSSAADSTPVVALSTESKPSTMPATPTQIPTNKTSINTAALASSSQPQVTTTTAPKEATHSLIAQVLSDTSGAVSTASAQTTVAPTVTTAPTAFGLASGSLFQGAPVPSSVPPSVVSTVQATAAATPATSTTTATATTASVSKSLFSNTVPSSSSVAGSAPAFGAVSASATPLFGQSVPASTSLFGQAPKSTAASVFGGGSSAVSSTVPPPAFGQSAPTSGSTSIFGQPTSSAPSDSPAGFGQSTAASTAIFGQSSTAPSSGSSSIFGQSSSTPATGSTSLFGQTGAASSGNSTSIFGPTTPASGGSVFGGSTQTTASSGFGFGKTAFGQPAHTATSGSTSVFGGSQPPAGTFGQASVFGATATTTTSSVFGGTPAPAASGDSVFGGGGGGGLFGGLGGKPSAENANKNVFGSTSFGSGAPQASGLFTAPSNNPFGAPKTATAGFGSSGAFSAGAGSISQQGFGGTQANTPGKSGFGGAPSFGGSPSFGVGGGTAFGGSPSFGSSPTFNSAFGGGAAAAAVPLQQPVFGGTANTEPNAGFAGFAQGNSPTFGSVAEQTGTAPGFGAPANGNAFGEASGGASAFGGGGGGTGSFGSSSFGNPAAQGSSFSSYRS